MSEWIIVIIIIMTSTMMTVNLRESCKHPLESRRSWHVRHWGHTVAKVLAVEGNKTYENNDSNNIPTQTTFHWVTSPNGEFTRDKQVTDRKDAALHPLPFLSFSLSLSLSLSLFPFILFLFFILSLSLSLSLRGNGLNE